MQKLFQFLYYYRAFIVFILLEVVSFACIVKSNSYQSAIYFTSSSKVTGNVLLVINDVYSYFKLQSINKELADENARLRKALAVKSILSNQVIPSKSQYLRAHAFDFKAVRVINNSTNRFNNYITLDKGSVDGLKPDMGVISPTGVVGKVYTCSENFSTVISLLHGKWSVSGKIIRGGIEGTVKWDGKNPRFAEMLYVGRHHKPKINDIIVTSGFNSVYPEGIPVGKIKEVSLDQGRPFYKIKLLLSTDFSKLSYVYVIENFLSTERDSLERDTVQINSGSFPK